MYFLKGWIILIPLLMTINHVCAQDVSPQIPDTLGQWYKPENKRQVWLHTMFAMRRELQAVEQYVDQSDRSGIEKWSERLMTHYRKLPVMVPEWKNEIELKLIEGLEESIQKGDTSKIRFNVRQLQKNCRSCHKKFSALVALKYRSADFSSLEIETADKVIKFSRFMKMISRTLNRVRIAAEDEHWENSLLASKQLQQELKYLGQTCSSCHQDDAPYERILGDSTFDSLKQMDVNIADKNINKVKQHLGGAAVKACARCHAVHRSLSDLRSQLFEH